VDTAPHQVQESGSPAISRQGDYMINDYKLTLKVQNNYLLENRKPYLISAFPPSAIIADLADSENPVAITVNFFSNLHTSGKTRQIIY
jgi:hypothetical protein